MAFCLTHSMTESACECVSGSVWRYVWRGREERAEKVDVMELCCENGCITQSKDGVENDVTDMKLLGRTVKSVYMCNYRL